MQSHLASVPAGLTILFGGFGLVSSALAQGKEAHAHSGTLRHTE